MPHDPEAFADMVVMHTKAALAPVLADVKSLQTQVAGWESRWNDLGALRERVAVVESKAATEPRLEPVVVPVVDLSPVLERVAAAEARLNVLGDLRDRVITVETKAAVPVNDTTADLRAKVDTVMASLGVIDTIDLRDRLAALEARPAVIPVQPEKSVDLSPVLERVSAVEHKLEMKGAELQPLMASVTETTKAIGDIRERIAVVETRQPVPGPAGTDGKNGTDGLGFEDMSAEFDGDRSISLKFERGTLKKLWSFSLPFLKYQGVYQEGKSYVQGDVATWGGSLWASQTETVTKPGEGSKDWVLCAKRGRDGKDGRDAEGALPVVAVGRAG